MLRARGQIFEPSSGDSKGYILIRATRFSKCCYQIIPRVNALPCGGCRRRDQCSPGSSDMKCAQFGRKGSTIMQQHISPQWFGEGLLSIVKSWAVVQSFSPNRPRKPIYCRILMAVTSLLVYSTEGDPCQHDTGRFDYRRRPLSGNVGLKQAQALILAVQRVNR